MAARRGLPTLNDKHKACLFVLLYIFSARSFLSANRGMSLFKVWNHFLKALLTKGLFPAQMTIQREEKLRADTDAALDPCDAELVFLY